jgi:Zn-finger nucleic acid-binding protein
MASSTVFLCPRCRIALHVGTTQNGAMHGCGRCGGIWLDRAMSERLTRALDSDTLALADAASQHAAQVEISNTRLGCPHCASVLTGHAVANARVHVDFCSTHGTWFDRDELQKVARAFAVSRAYGGAHSGAAAMGGAAVLGAGTAALALGSYPLAPNARQTEEGATSALEVGGEALDVGLEAASAAPDIAEAGSGALELAGGAFEILGGIFEGLG